MESKTDIRTQCAFEKPTGERCPAGVLPSDGSYCLLHSRSKEAHNLRMKGAYKRKQIFGNKMSINTTEDVRIFLQKFMEYISKERITVSAPNIKSIAEVTGAYRSIRELEMVEALAEKKLQGQG